MGSIERKHLKKQLTLLAYHMEQSTYYEEEKISTTHWWFVNRRRLFTSELQAVTSFSNETSVLDIGISSGTNLKMLKELGCERIFGVDISTEAVSICNKHGFNAVLGSVENLPFDDNSFDIILATDVLEHLDDEAVALEEISRVLKEDGIVLFTVPAFQVLWGHQDIVAHHKRRYTLKAFTKIILQHNFNISRSYYFNFLLFFPILLYRKFVLLLKRPVRGENSINTTIVNKIFSAIFFLDIMLAPLVRPPFGVSILAIASPKNKPVP